VSIALEKAFFEIIENGKANGGNFHTKFEQIIRFCVVADLQLTSLVIALSWIFDVNSACFFAVLVRLDLRTATIPPKKWIN